jgi:adenine-specific DNA-methyltransferase
MAKKTTNSKKEVTALTHDDSVRPNIPTAEQESVMHDDQKSPLRIAYERRNRDLDPQLVWRGKDEQDWSDLVVKAPPLYIQEKVHPKVLIDDLMRRTERAEEDSADQFSLFEAFEKGLEESEKTEFYKHDQNWTNRMILGDSLEVMASLAEREGLRGKVQCIYIDPPYGIKFNSNFQWSTTSRDVKDGKADHITREPEQVKAFRDTWRDGIHSYLTYLRDRFTVARDLLTDSGSIFVQIGDENVHRVRAVMDEVFGEENFHSLIAFKKTLPLGSSGLAGICDYILWYSKSRTSMKYRDLLDEKPIGAGTGYTWLRDKNYIERKMTSEERNNPKLIEESAQPFFSASLSSSGYTVTCMFDIEFEGRVFAAGKKSWRTHIDGMARLIRANRIIAPGGLPCFKTFHHDFPTQPLHNIWDDTHGASDLTYVVQTSNKVIQRCILMTTDPGDLVLDPTCGSGTTATVAEQWGRRWITIDTSRVALALARARIMGAKYPYYLLSDSPEGQKKEAEISQSVPSSHATQGSVRHGFVYQRVPHITLKSIANNAEIDVIWDKWQETLEPLRESLNAELKKSWEEWEIPRETDDSWSAKAKDSHSKWWDARIARQKEIDASIAAKAEYEYLYDKPYEDKKKVRVAGPFTVETLSPHRTISFNENDEMIDPLDDLQRDDSKDFVSMILENLRCAGVQQSAKEDKIDFEHLTEWPGRYICAEAFYSEGDNRKRAGIFIGPEFGTVSRADLVAAAREAGDAGFDVVISCAFNYDAHSSEFEKLGRVPVLKARMNADLHMADDLKNTGKGNLFVIFGEPDIELEEQSDGKIQVTVKGIDVFDPSTGEVRSENTDGIACWFIDTDYNEESFFIRHAYFLGAGDPYKSLKTTLKAEIDADAWASLYGDKSRPFKKPSSGRIAVKVINHLGDEVMKVFRV